MKFSRTTCAITLLAACGLFTAGCQTAKTSEEQCKPAVAGAAADPGMINAACPLMPKEDARGSGISVAYTGTQEAWKGKKVAFCCDGCTHDWEKMTQAQRDAALTKVAVK